MKLPLSSFPIVPNKFKFWATRANSYEKVSTPSWREFIVSLAFWPVRLSILFIHLFFSKMLISFSYIIVNVVWLPWGLWDIGGVMGFLGVWGLWGVWGCVLKLFFLWLSSIVVAVSWEICIFLEFIAVLEKLLCTKGSLLLLVENFLYFC